jgi:hypothetical protein
VVSVIVVALAGVGVRSIGILSPPMHPDIGTEATFAAVANVIAGNVEPLEQVPGSLIPAVPWVGTAPVDPNRSLPVYNWISGFALKLFGANEWPGRLISVIFSLLSGLALFALVRRVAGARAALYAILIFALSPLSIAIGSQFAPFALLLLFQTLAVLSLIWWHDSTAPAKPGGSRLLFVTAVMIGVLAVLLSAGALALLAPAVYVVLASGDGRNGLRAVWTSPQHRGRILLYLVPMVVALIAWELYRSSSSSALLISVQDGGGGLAGAASTIFNSSSYAAVVGAIAGSALTLVGLLLLAAGLVRPARAPLQWVFQFWIVGAAIVALLDSARLPRHDDVLIPLLPPIFALAGMGAAWAGSLPARVWIALVETRKEQDAEFAVSPHTAWLLDVPEQKVQSAEVRPQAKPALAKTLSQRSRNVGSRVRRAGLMLAGHLAVLGAIGAIGLAGQQAIAGRFADNPDSGIVSAVSREIALLTPTGARLIMVGPNTPSLFHGARRTGWALPELSFSLTEVQKLHREGASYLLTMDQEWLGQQPDYVGVLSNYAVAKLSRNYILFDLNKKPAQSDRLYFLESGHTLGGVFRRFWETNGGVEKLGFPISEELREVNPLDGQERKIQYFERAVLEQHDDFSGSPNQVMLASVGRWVTQGRNFQPISPFQNSANRVYFPHTGHSVKESFLRFWLKNGDVRQFGYPISEEVPEISAEDGKVYTVQYFERARFEWHPIEAGGPNEVQLGLIGKQAYEKLP